MRRKPERLIPIEMAILDAALRLRARGTNAVHGYQLAKFVRTDSDSRMLTAHGTLYRALHRLERSGLLEAFWERPEMAEKDGRPRRRMYRVTASSAGALARARSELRANGRIRELKEGLGPI